MVKRERITAERLRELLTYNPDTGEIHRKIQVGRHKAGTRAGGFDDSPRHGYRVVTVDGITYTEHRVAWVLHYGAWPEKWIDHINGDRLDNRLVNLRPADALINNQNRRSTMTGKKSCDLLGVFFMKDGGRWYSQIRTKAKLHWLGFHPTPEAAHAAYIKAKRILHEGCTI